MGLMKQNPMAGVRQLRITKQSTLALTHDEFQELLKGAVRRLAFEQKTE
jgi:hypothetical protein